MELAEAREIALALAAEMAPFVERVAVAGSIRRERPEVKDLELVAVPRWVEAPDPYDLLGESTIRQNELWRWAAGSAVWWIKPGTNERIPWRIDPDGKYWRGVVGPFEDGIKLDLFLATPENYGLIYLIRTGSAEFSQAVVTHARTVGLRSEGGRLLRGEEALNTPEEADVFRLLGLAEVPPPARIGAQSLRQRPS